MRFKLTPVDHLPEEGIELPDKLLPFIWYFVRQGKWQFLLIFLIFAVSNITEALNFYFIKIFVDIFERVGAREEIWGEMFWPFLLFVALCLIIQPVAARVGQGLIASVQPRFANMMRRQLAYHMNSHSYQYFQDDFAGRLSSKVIETPIAIAISVRIMLTSIFYAVVTLVLSAVFMFFSHWSFAAVTLFWIVAYAILLRVYIPKISADSKEAFDRQSKARGRYVDIITNILTVKLFARRRHEDQYFLDSLKDNAKGFETLHHRVNYMYIWLEVISVVYILAIFWLVIWGWQNELLSAGDIAMVLPLSLRLMNISWWISETLSMLFESIGQIREGMETVTKKHTVTDAKDAQELHVKGADIEMKEMSFFYGSTMVFKNFNLKIPAGQKVGLIGPSGAGKSSLMQLLLRLYDVQDGEILIDGQNIASVQQDSLREHIAVIPQSTDLLHRSLRDNIGYGKLDATEEEIIAAAKRAYAHDFILNMEDKDGNTGYDAMVGERGVKLSGGQRQRIAIARAILKDAPILILDEATSALDSESEKLIQDSLKGLMEGKTVIAIAHRLSTIAHLDRLIVMNEGQIIEDGTHADLLKQKDGLYAKLWSMQSGGFLNKEGSEAA